MRDSLADDQPSVDLVNLAQGMLAKLTDLTDKELVFGDVPIDVGTGEV